MYRWIFDYGLVHTDPEIAHEVAIKAIELAGSSTVARAGMGMVFDYADTSIPAGATFLPRRLKGRLGLAAGMDKNALAVEGMAAMGFGFLEIGTVTPRPQPGNDKPRLWRLPASREIRNRMGFNNDGVDIVKQRLKKLRSTPAGRQIVVGANIGKNKVTANADAASDYEICARELARFVDFLVINVSSPNTPGLRSLQSTETLRPIIETTLQAARKSARRDVPVFVKIAPDLTNEDILEVADLAKELGLAGVVAANTTIKHTLGEGGVSGPRLLKRGLEIVKMLREHLDPEQTIIAVGGISTPEDALAYLDAGADLLEAFTAYIYEGPTWPGKINRAIAKSLREGAYAK
ncbi:quinone-dependent dihydroorotate dehydrogenase [Actinomyces urinae]|uniref:quinone-dependent dihydroorotate dehydrogenase n=1 Tax=Actinomyces urinae TaxID=1689268 RepID=UPI0009303E87|nr:quinone-dependent dihydroorotate dehydrogenase [Actinomyces urinae]